MRLKYNFDNNSSILTLDNVFTRELGKELRKLKNEKKLTAGNSHKYRPQTYSITIDKTSNKVIYQSASKSNIL